MTPATPKTSHALKIYSWIVILLGAIALGVTLYRTDFIRLGESYFIFVLITFIFASRIMVRIPGVNGHISVSDTFVFLSILVFGGEAGILLAVLDAIPGSHRLSKTRTTFFFNIAVFAVSTFVTVTVLRSIFGPLFQLSGGVVGSQYVAAICLMGLFQYALNSGLVAANVALRTGNPIWQMWKDNFLWTSLTYFAGASAAGFIAKLVDAFGIYAFLAATPIAAVVYFTYTTYLKNVEAAASQALIAQNHVRELSHHIAEQERIARALQESEQYFRNAFDHAAGMAVVGLDGRWLQVNESLCKMLGYAEQELLQNGFQAVTHPSDLGNDLENLQLLLADKISDYQLEKRYCHKTGSTVWVLQSTSLIRDLEGNPRHVIFQIQDISDRKKGEELIHHAAFHDGLTGLPNRTLFTDRLSMAIERGKRSNSYQFAVIFLDLDRFKVVNDSLGHDSGDKLLIELSRRLETCVRTVDSVARLGGDEFVILLDGIDSLREAEDVAERIQLSLRAPFDVGGESFCTTASMGIACSTLNYDRPEDILRDADTAMYRAKAKGKACYEIFVRQMHTRAVEALTVESELRRALDNGEIKPHFQPIVSLATGEIVGFEALARWVHAERGLISPADFIPLAEETGLIVPMGMTILKQACGHAARWQEEFNRPDLSISVNLSSKQFKQHELLIQIEDILKRANLAPRSLKIEITETMVIDNIAAAIVMLKKLRRIGVQISIDDFGTGYSSLSYLHRFPFHILKIDRCFISRMLKNKESLGIVKAIVTLANELNKEIIAEGVEEEEQRLALKSIGCQYAQGYLFSKPLDVRSAGKLLEASVDNFELEQSFAAHSAQLIG